MDNGFPILDDYSDDQAFRQLESLLDDASNQLPDLDSGGLGDNSHHGSSDTMDLGGDLFETACGPSSLAHNTSSYSLPSPGGPMLTQARYGPPSVGSQPPPSPAMSHSHGQSVPPSPSPLTHPLPSPASHPPPPSPAQTHQFSAPSPAPPLSPSHHHPLKSPASFPPPSSPAQVLYAKSPAPHLPPPSPRAPSTPGPPILSPQPAQASPILLSSLPQHPLGTVLASPQLSMASVAGMQPIQLHPAMVSGAQPMFQIQLQPNVSMQSLATSPGASPSLQPKGKQPQLLPKPTTTAAQTSPASRPLAKQGVQYSTSLGQPIMTVPGVPISAPSTSQPTQYLLNQATGQIINTMGTQQQQVFMAMGGGQVLASSASQPAPLLIQQPGALQGQQQMIVLRPGGPNMQTLVPMPVQGVQGVPSVQGVQGMPGVQGVAAGQQIMMVQAPQQAQGQQGLLGGQPQVKLITPQGKMTMQQINTPTGPKFIAVPLGQTLMQGQAGLFQGATLQGAGPVQLGPNGQLVQLQQAAGGQIFSSQSSVPSAAISSSATGQAFTLQASPSASQPQVIWSSSSVTRTSMTPLLSTSVTTSSAGTSVIQPTQALDGLTVNGLAPVSPKKKKSKKKKRDDESPTKSQGTVDLGALLKDSGIDFDDFGFGGLPAASGLGSSSSTSSAAVSTPTVATVIAPVPEQMQQTQQQPPVIELNDSGPSLNSSIGSTSSEPADLLPALPQLSFAPTPVQPQPTMQLVQMQDGSFRLEPNQGAVPPSSADSNPASNSLSSSPLPNSNASSSSQSVDQKKFPGRVPPRSRPVVDPNRTPLFEDDTLPHGWHRKVSQRKSGASAGRYEVFIIGPTHKRFRSRNELKSFFEKTGETTLNPDDFDFSTFGRNNTVGVSKGPVMPMSMHVSSPAPASPMTNTSRTPAQPTPSVIVPSTSLSTIQPIPSATGFSQSETELIKTLEMSGMASVAAAKALETTQVPRNSLLQSIQQPLPQASLSTLLPSTSGQAGPPRVPMLTLPPPGQPHQPGPLTAEMNDAEAQISLLLDSLQKQQDDGLADSDFFNDLTAPPSTSSAPPERIKRESGVGLQTESNVHPTNSSTFPKGRLFPDTGGGVPSPSMPVLTPQMPVLTPETSRQAGDASNKYLDNARSQLSEREKRAGRTRQESGSGSAMPLLSPTTGLMHSPSSPSSPRSAASSSVIQSVPRPMDPAGGPPNITAPNHSLGQQHSSQGVGGPASQLRALSNLPQDHQVRLVRSNGGQYSHLQLKTVELAPDMRSMYQRNDQRITEIKNKAAKTPKDEAELAGLQAKQHQILSTGQVVRVGGPPPPGPVLGAGPQLQPPTRPPIMSSSMLPRQPLAPPPNLQPRLPSTGTGPPLTDHQKKIVHEFKANLARLPPEQQGEYIAHNKQTLIKQLNFHPSQMPYLARQPAPPHTSQHPEQIPVVVGCQVVPPGANPPRIQVTPLRTSQEAAPTPMLYKKQKSKQELAAWVESQMKKDQQEALNPSYKIPFRNKDDACKRLLRYHVFDERDAPVSDLMKADAGFARKSEQLLSKYHSMLSKYHLLLLKESTRMCSSSEEVMLARHWEADERASLSREKEEAKKTTSRLEELEQKSGLTAEERLEVAQLRSQAEPKFGPVPESWAARYEAVLGRPFESERARSRSWQQTSEQQTLNLESSDRQPPPPDIEIKREPDLFDRGELDLFSQDLGLRLRHGSNSSLESDQKGRFRTDSGGSRLSNTSSALAKKELRVSLTNVLSSRPGSGTDSPLVPSSRPSSTEFSSMDQGAGFLGIKFNRTMSGRWSANLKREKEEGEEEGGEDWDEQGLGMQPAKRMREYESQGSQSDESEDEEFSLADVGGNNAAVQNMLENDDMDDEDELRFDSQSRTSFDRFDPSGLRFHGESPALGSEQGNDNDSVQNAINSILDLHDRGGVQTPDDLNNLHGLLESMEADHSDPTLDAAVNSIL